MVDNVGSDGIEGVLLLLVEASGRIAKAAFEEIPNRSHLNLPSGFRGGFLQHHRVQDTFFKAQTRWACVSREPLLSHVQADLLSAMYQESHAKCRDSWRATMDASESYAILLRTCNLDWASGDSKMLRRSYWACFLYEAHCQLDQIYLPRQLLFFRIKFHFLHFPKSQVVKFLLCRRRIPHHCQRICSLQLYR